MMMLLTRPESCANTTLGFRCITGRSRSSYALLVGCDAQKNLSPKQKEQESVLNY